MRLLKQALAVLGAFVVFLAIAALVAPKAARGVAAALVQVTNTSANPVPTVATDNPAAQPFQSFSTGSQLLFGVSVPVGKRLVIENISAACVDATPILSDMRVFTTAGGNFAQYTSAPQTVGTQEIIWNQPGRLYADSGTGVTIGTGAGTASGSNCAASLSGYLVNTP